MSSNFTVLFILSCAGIAVIMLWVQALCRGEKFPALDTDNLMMVLVCSLFFPLFFLVQDTYKAVTEWRERKKKVAEWTEKLDITKVPDLKRTVN